MKEGAVLDGFVARGMPILLAPKRWNYNILKQRLIGISSILEFEISFLLEPVDLLNTMQYASYK